MLCGRMNRRRFFALSAAAVTHRAWGQAAAGPADQPLLSFGLLTDVQYADADPEGERHYRESIPKLQAAVADLAHAKLPFTLHLGDLIDRDFSSFAAILPVFQKLGHPARHVPGNHDFNVPDADKGRVTATLGMPHDYYSFSSSGVKFVMLDTNDISTYKHPQGSAMDDDAENSLKLLAEAKANNAQPWNGGVTAVQLGWLENQLAAADAAKEPVIVCGHHPLLPESGHQAWRSRQIVAVLERHPCVRAYFCGHNHAGNETIAKGVPYITFKSILHQPGVTAYAVVRLFKDRLAIDGRGREKSRVIPLPKVD
jgi:manganese-dependent ADP-ribose/CDP-alcohol diphosphatase